MPSPPGLHAPRDRLRVALLSLYFLGLVADPELSGTPTMALRICLAADHIGFIYGNLNFSFPVMSSASSSLIAN